MGEDYKDPLLLTMCEAGDGLELTVEEQKPTTFPNSNRCSPEQLPDQIGSMWGGKYYSQLEY